MVGWVDGGCKKGRSKGRKDGSCELEGRHDVAALPGTNTEKQLLPPQLLLSGGNKTAFVHIEQITHSDYLFPDFSKASFSRII